MKIGTKSILFGVHNFLWHPFTVLLAYQELYHCVPTFEEFIAILTHDLGYWGSPNIDGEEGRRHPALGAFLASVICFALNRDENAAYEAAIGHSREYAKQYGTTPSRLCWADKWCVSFEPDWFYLFRARVSGELQEYKQRAIDTGHLLPGATDRDWMAFYRNRIKSLPEIKTLLRRVY